ncbi:MAG: PTS fructose transporter subunit IIA, partial [Deltaproteobacteria bacterium]|nr:PTS fructose transporter subunit IIA [Deltaproteobacteria bacterium]
MNIGVVIVTHYGLGEEFLQALRLIIPDAPDFQSVSIDPSQTVDEMRSRIGGGIKDVDTGDGVLVLTDMFGGTPSNIALS